MKHVGQRANPADIVSQDQLSSLLDLAGTQQMTGAIEWADAANIGPTGTAATTFLDIGAANSNVVVISGTAPGPVVWLNNAAAAKGSWRIVRFDGNYTLTYNVQRIVLPGAANIVTAVGDYAMFRYLGPVDTWECVWYTKANGRAVNPSDPTALDLAGTRPMTGALKEAPPVFIDSGTGSTLNLATANANTVYANGTGTVESLGEGTAGQTKRVYFQQAMTLRHSISLIDLPGQANIVTALGDWAEFYCGGNSSWICLQYQRRNGQALAAPSAPVSSVAGRTGAVVLVKADAGLDQVDNTSDASKPISSLQQAAFETLVNAKDWGLQVAGVDFDALTERGIYRIRYQATMPPEQHRPDFAAGSLSVFWWGTTNANLFQIYYSQSLAVFIRSLNGTWTDWAKLSTTAEVLAQIRSFGLGLDASGQSPSASDANTAVVPATYRMSAAGLNKPTSAGGLLRVTKSFNTIIMQEFFATPAAGALYTRISSDTGATWTTWDPSQTVAGSLRQMQNFGLGQAQAGVVAQGSVVPTPAGLGNTSATQAITVGGDTTTTDTATNHNPVSGETFSGWHMSSALRPKQMGVSGVGSGSTLWWRGYQGASANASEWRRATVHGSPTLLGQFTLTTLPSASAFAGHLIDVTNATGGPKTCRSNGTVWQILNTTTTVS